MSNARSLANFGGIVSGMTGEVKMWPLNTAPNGYLICNGQAVRRADYAALYATIGTTFGSGDGASTFNLPNYTDRMPVGKGTIASTIGSVGGSKDAVVVNHTHSATVNDAGHQHASGMPHLEGGQYGTKPASNITQAGWGNAQRSAYSVLTDRITTGISVTNSAAGVSATNANLPPYIGINFIIKY